MNRSLSFFSLLLAGIAISAVLYAQNAPAPEPNAERNRQDADLDGSDIGGPGMSGRRESPLEAVRILRRRLDELKRDPQQFKDDAQFEDVVRTTLGELFDYDMEYRKQALTALARRIERSEAQLDQRQQAREELIDLQLRSVKMDAQGFGLSTNGPHSSDSPGVSGQPSGAHYPPSIYSSGSAFYYPSDMLLGSTSAVDTAYSARIRSGRAAADPRRDALAQIRAARQALAESKDADAEAKVLEDLEAALGDYFDADLKVRRKELEAVKQQLRELESKLTERANAKSDVIDLQLKLIVNEANGLGFFSRTNAIHLPEIDDAFGRPQRYTMPPRR